MRMSLYTLGRVYTTESIGYISVCLRLRDATKQSRLVTSTAGVITANSKRGQLTADRLYSHVH